MDVSVDIFEIKESHSKFLSHLTKVSNSDIFILINKIHEKIGKFYLKTISGDSEYLDFEKIKGDYKLMRLLEKIEDLTNNFRNLIFNEELIGVFHDLKYYIS